MSSGFAMLQPLAVTSFTPAQTLQAPATPSLPELFGDALTRILSDGSLAASLADGTAATFLLDLVELERNLLAGSWERPAHALSQVLDAFAAAGCKLERVVAPFCGRLRCGKDELLTILKALSESALSQTCRWMAANWHVMEKALAACTKAVRKELEAAIRFVASLGEKAAGAAAGALGALRTLYLGACGLPSLVQAPELSRAKESVHDLLEVLRGGPSALFTEAGRRMHQPPGEALRAWVHGNDLTNLLKQRGDQLQGLFSALRAAGAASPVPAALEGGALQGVRELLWAADAAPQFATWLQGVLFAGDSSVDTPFTAELSAHHPGLGEVTLDGSSGAAGTTLLPAAVADVQSFAAHLWAEAAPNFAFLAVDASQHRMVLPGPGERALGQSAKKPKDGLHVQQQIPLLLPPGVQPGLAIGHLADCYLLDLRYGQIPYGKLVAYKPADLDHDYVVRAWEVEAQRHAAGGDKGFGRGAVDCDGDGEVTAEDVRLATEQQTLYVGTLMYRRAAALLAVRVSLTPHNWFYAGLASLKDESVPGRLSRFGVVLFEDAQLSLFDWPLRYHCETRVYADVLPTCALAQAAIGIYPQLRYDLVLRAGQGAGDLQLYANFSPTSVLDVLARCWTVKANFVGRYSLNAGVATFLGVNNSGDLRLGIVYEATTPLGQVLSTWQKRLVDAGHSTVEEAKKLLADPVGTLVDQVTQLALNSDIGRILRALVRASGPFLDLLFGWADEEPCVLKCALGFLRQTVLLGNRAGWTWQQVLSALEQWGGQDLAGYADGPSHADGHHAASLARAAVERHLQAAGRQRSAPAFDPREVRAVVESALSPQPGGGAEKLRALAAVACGYPRPPRAPLGRGKPAPVNAAAAELAALAQQGQTPPPVPARFVATFEQLAGERLQGEVQVPGLGRFTLDDAGVVTWSTTRSSPASPQKDFVKPLFGSLLRFGPGAALCSAPSRGLQVCALAENTLGVVEGPRLLVDAETGAGRGGFWLFVRTPRHGFGWVWGGPDLSAVVSTRAVDGHALRGLDLDPSAAAPGAATGPIAEAAASMPGTVDDSRWAGRARTALLAAAPSKFSADLSKFLDQAAKVLKLPLLGEVSGAVDLVHLGLAFQKLKPDAQHVYWQQVGADLKALYYLSKLGGDLMDAVSPMARFDAGGTIEKLAKLFSKAHAHATPLELAAAADVALPALIEALGLVKDVVGNIADVVGAVKGAVGSSTQKTDLDDGVESKWRTVKKTLKEKGATLHDLDSLVRVLAMKMRLLLPSWLAKVGPDWTAELPATAEEPKKRPKKGDYAPAEETNWVSMDDGLTLVAKGWGERAGHDESTTDVAVFSDGKVGSATHTTKSGTGDGTLTQSTTSSASGASWDSDEGVLSLGDFSYGSTAGAAFGAQKKDDDDDDAKKAHDGGERSGEVKLDFGDDSLTFNWSLQEGGGAGAGTSVGPAGASASATVSFKVHGTAIKIPVKLLFASKEALGVGLRFFVRLGLHTVDALRCIGAEPGNRKDEIPRVLVGSLLAVVEAMRDLVRDHPAFLARVLEGVKGHLQVEVSAGVLGSSPVVGGEANGTVSLDASVPLSTLLAPLVDFLDTGGPRPEGVAGLADRIIPQIKVEVQDRLCVKVNTAHVGLEVESKGKLAEAQLMIPPTSQLRAKLREGLERVRELVEAHTKALKSQLPHPVLDALKGALETADRLLRDELLSGSGGGATTDFSTPDPTVSSIVSLLSGAQTQANRPAPSLDEQVELAARALQAARVRGVSFAPGASPLQADPNGSTLRLTLHVTDDERARLGANGWVPLPAPDAPVPAVETLVYRVPLPGPAPDELAWALYQPPGVTGDFKPLDAVSGIAAGFELRPDAVAFAAARSAVWLAGASKLPPQPEEREGLFWVWVEAGLAAATKDGAAALPGLSLDCGALVCTFTAVPPGVVEAAAVPLFQGLQPASKQQLWSLPLATAATRDDFERLAALLVA